MVIILTDRLPETDLMLYGVCLRNIKQCQFSLRRSNLFYDYGVINVHRREFKIQKKQKKNQTRLEITYINQHYAMSLVYVVVFEQLLGALVFQRRRPRNCLESRGEGMSPPEQERFSPFY